MYAAIIAILTGDADVLLLVAQRIEPGFIRQDPELPCISYLRQGGDRPVSQSGSSNLDDATYQLDCWAATYAKANELGAAVRNAFQGYQGTAGGVVIQGAFVEADSDAYEDAPDLWRLRIEINIWGEEE